MELRILGPLEVLVEGRDVTPRPAKQRALLVMLLLHAPEPVAMDLLVEALWGERPPPTALTALHGYVSALRKLLGAERIETRSPGYLLRVEPGELDAERFESLVAEARRVGDPDGRSQRLSLALALWRGASLADFRYEEFALAEIARLEELRLTAIEDRVEAELALGRHTELLAELERLAADEPLRERLRGQLMLALYRTGRQADALHAFQQGRRLLVEELGIDPGPALQELERQILEQDPALAQPQSPAAARPRQERKRVTLLVAELSGPSDPEELGRLLEPALARASEVAAGFGASVQPLFTNALIGVFGAPRAYDDDTQRALHAGAALVDAFQDDERLTVRVGIERGDALVTITGDRIEVTGEVVALAFRLQATAPANEVAVGEAFERASAIGEGREVRFVGRRHELGLLQHTHGRVVGENAAQLVMIAGEPGSGKTRLAREFAASLERTESHTWLAGRCLPYGHGVTFWALGEIVKAAAGILESDDSATSARKLASAVATLLPASKDRVWVETSLAPLVGLAVSQSGAREQPFLAWRRFLEAIAASKPLVLLIEDLHWADPALLDFLDDLVHQAAGVPLLVLCTARLELLDSYTDWAGWKPNTATIALSALSGEETRELARALLGGEEPSEALVRRAGGNPLFIQELVRIEATDATLLPESLQGVIAARLDTLAPAVKQAALDAAVIGEIFWPGAVAAVAGTDEAEVEDRLTRLAAAEVVRRTRLSSVKGQDEHSFLHVLVRDVAYEQIPRAERAEKHIAAAAWIAQLAGERVIDHAELIAHHYLAALDYTGDVDAELRAKARRFLTVAGDRAVQLDVPAAERLYGRALELVSADDVERGQLLARLGRAALEAGRLDEAERLYEEAIVALRAGGDAPALGGALTEMYRVLWRRGRTRETRSVLAEALCTFDRDHPTSELAIAYLVTALTHLMAGRPQRAFAWAERARALGDRLGIPHLVVHALQYRGLARFDLNDLDGIGDIREALRLGLEAVSGNETAMAYNHLAELSGLIDGPERSLDPYTEGIEFAERRGLFFDAHWLRTEMLESLFALGRWDELLASAGELVGWDRRGGESQITPISLAYKACVLVRRGAVAEARSLVAAFLQPARAIADQQVLAQALACAALVEREDRDDGAALECVWELERSTRGRAPIFFAPHVTDVARVCAAIGVGALEPVKRLVSRMDVVAPDLVYRHLSARAVLTEAEGAVQDALAAYTEAAANWLAFGNVVEEAYALLGRGRCLRRLGRHEQAAEALAAARVAFERLGALPLVAEVDEHLAHAGV